MRFMPKLAVSILLAMPPLRAARADDAKTDGAARKPAGARRQPPFASLPPQLQEAMKNMASMSKLAQEQDARRLEALRKSNPKAYAAQKEAAETERNIQAILQKSRKTRMSDYDVEQELRPLMKKKLKPEFDDLNGRIACLEKKAEFYRGAQKDYDILIHRRIEELRGKRRRDKPCE